MKSRGTCLKSMGNLKTAEQDTKRGDPRSSGPRAADQVTCSEARLARGPRCLKSEIWRQLLADACARPAGPFQPPAPLVKVQMGPAVGVARTIIKRGRGRGGGDSGDRQTVGRKLREISQSVTGSLHAADVSHDARLWAL